MKALLVAATVVLTATVPIAIAVATRDALFALATQAGCGERVPPALDSRGVVDDPHEPRALIVMDPGGDENARTMTILVSCERLP